MPYHAAIGAVRPYPLALPLFITHAVASLKAAQKADGCIWAGTNSARGLAFSLSVWDSPAAMRRYAASAPHARAMRWSRLTGEVTRFHHFACDEVPSWAEAIGRWDKMMELVPQPL
jgi:hypothetical protein